MWGLLRREPRRRGARRRPRCARPLTPRRARRAQYVAECFSNSSLFHKALKEAFESFCNKQVAGSSSAELMANFCDNLLKKARAGTSPP
jgi:hypothetical protein